MRWPRLRAQQHRRQPVTRRTRSVGSFTLAEQLIAPQGGSIVSVYHDIDVSRSLPWSRRPPASQLLEDAKSKSRHWSRLVIGETQRAFLGPQFQLVLPVLTHFGIELWVPELGGPVDPDSEAHDLVMNLFGGLSKAERRRIQHRTTRVDARARLKRSLARRTTELWLPPRGHRPCTPEPPQDGLRHQSSKPIEPDPQTGPVVQRIFEMFDQGVGYRTIASRLEAEGILSAGEIGPTKHPRSAGVWSGSTVRTILMNPRYLGHQVAGRQRRYDQLLDTMEPAQGTVSKQRSGWPKEAWSWSDDASWPALVAPRALRPRQSTDHQLARGGKGPRPRKSGPSKYVLSGLIHCHLCGKSMHGSTMKGKAYYRCAATNPDYAEPSVAGHPPRIRSTRSTGPHRTRRLAESAHCSQGA